jgi:ABC-type multidrug transport system fused ATPase/permease subunit
LVDGRALDIVKGLIEFKNVTFTYPARDNVLIFNDLSFSVSPGETVAIVGSSGSGKSTIAQLLLGFYAPSSGHIYIDGNDIQELNISTMREKVISVVPQEVRFFVNLILT